MIRIKFTGEDCAAVQAASVALQSARREKNKQEKSEDAAKEIITRYLLDRRDVNLDLLPEGEFVLVQCDGEDVVKIDVKGVQRFDGKAFAIEHPKLKEQFTRLVRTKYFESLLR